MTLQRLLESVYDLQIRSLTPAPRGFVAETFVAQTYGDERYFVKVWTSRLPHQLSAGLRVLDELYRLGMTEINRPIATRSGALAAPYLSGRVAVFNYIEGTATLDYDVEAFGSLLGRIHAFGGQIRTPLEHETFTPIYPDELLVALADVLRFHTADMIVVGLQQFLRAYENEIARDWRTFERLCANCRGSQFAPVLAHGDAVGNVIVGWQGEIHVVDWDEPMIAPRERDTWFLVDVPAFLAGYRRHAPDYRPNPLAYRYYVFNRYWEDLLGYVQEIVGTGSDEHRAWNLRELHNTCVEWLRPKMRALDELRGS